MKNSLIGKIFSVMLTACFAAVFSAGCSEKKPALVLDGNSDGGTFQAAEGDIIEVRLSGNAGTGYSWFMSDSDFFKKEGEAASEAEGNVPVTGGPVSAVFRIRAVSAGTASLSFVYMRPWEKDEPAAETFSAEIKIRPAEK